MSKTNNMIDDNSFVQFNSLITLSIVSDDYEKTNYTKYLVTDENLDYLLCFKLCKKPLLEYSNLINSYFFIRNIDECASNIEMSDENDKPKKNSDNMGKELNYLSKEKINQNNYFYLQHMLSRKFVSIERKDNCFVLKLLNNIDNPATFSLRKINEKRNSNNIITSKEIYHLSIYIKEDNIFYYVQDDKNQINKENNNNYNILISKNQITKFIITQQNWNIKDSKNLYSGQLINIIFTNIKENKEEQLMLSVGKKEKNNIIVNNDNEQNKNDNNNDINNQYKVIGLPYSDELSEHALNNSFWVIEENLENYNCINKQPIKIKQFIRIKNLNTGL